MNITFEFANDEIEFAVMTLLMGKEYDRSAWSAGPFLEHMDFHYIQDNDVGKFRRQHFDLSLHGHSSSEWYTAESPEAQQEMHKDKRKDIIVAIIHSLDGGNVEINALTNVNLPELKGDQRDGKRGLTNIDTYQIDKEHWITYILDAVYYM